MKKPESFKFISVIITILLIALLFSQIKVRDIIEILYNINPIYLIAGFILYIISHFLKALRFYVLLNREVKIRDLFSIVCIHTLAVNILPARSGELSYIYLLNKNNNKSIKDGVHTLILSRILDIIAILILFFTLIILTKNLPEIIIKSIPYIFFLALLIVLVLLMLIYKLKRVIRSLKKISIHLQLNDRSFLNNIFNKLDNFAESNFHVDRKQFIISVIISFWIWIILYSVIYVIIIAMDVDIEFGAFMLATTFYLMISILPVQGIGGFGTFEGGWAISFMAVGVIKEIAISSGFIIHIIFIVYIMILALFGYYYLKNPDKLLMR